MSLATIERVFPTQVALADGLKIQDHQLDAAVNKSPFGPPVAMRYAEGVLRNYSGKFEDLTAESTDIKRLVAFFETVPTGYGLSWLTEIISETHRKLRCPGIGDGSKKCFIAPIAYSGGAITGVFVDGVLQATGNYSTGKATLMPTDNDTNGDGGTAPSSVTAGYSLSVTEADSSLGYTAFMDSPSSAVIDAKLTFAPTLTITAGTKYTANVSFLAETGTYEFRLIWRDASSVISTSIQSITTTADGWTSSTYTETAPTGATIARLRIVRTSSSSNPIVCGGVSIQAGDLTSLFLPDSQPIMLTFATAPAAGAVITVSGTGKRMTKVRWNKPSPRQQFLLGHTVPGAISAVEVRT